MSFTPTQEIMEIDIEIRREIDGFVFAFYPGANRVKSKTESVGRGFPFFLIEGTAAYRNLGFQRDF